MVFFNVLTQNINHLIVWYQEFDGGKMIYNGLGFANEVYTDAVILNDVELNIH